MHSSRICNFDSLIFNCPFHFPKCIGFFSMHFSRFFKRGDEIIECENKTDNLLALSAVNKNEKIATTIMNKENKSVDFFYENNVETKSFSIPPRSIITITEK